MNSDRLIGPSPSQPLVAKERSHSYLGAAARRWLLEPQVEDPAKFLSLCADRLLSNNDVSRSMDELSDGLFWLRRRLVLSEWRRFSELATHHPIAQLVWQDPFTCRSFSKPRGYAGDAVLLDLIYYDLGLSDVNQATALGQSIYQRNKDTPAPTAVRERRDFLAALIDTVCDELSSPTILSVACGHLRECSLAHAVTSQRFNRFVALDQDSLSLKEVSRCYGQFGVETAQLSVKSLLRSDAHNGQYDLVYAAGLYDYLDQEFGKRLTARLFALLRPGGRLILANFAPNIFDVGYMETFMGWFLVFRSVTEVTDLASLVPDKEVNLAHTFTLSSSDVVYLELRKRRLATTCF